MSSEGAPRAKEIVSAMPAGYEARPQVGLPVRRRAGARTSVRRMSELPELRVSDADREATVVRLRHAGGEGRLTLEELAERVELADAARTRGDLDVLTADLPAASGLAPPPAPPGKDRRWVVAIMGGETRKGRWRPSRRTNAVAVMGGIDIDLREAELADGAEFLAIGIMGAVSIVVPEGVSVEMSGFAFMGGNSGPDDRIPP